MYTLQVKMFYAAPSVTPTWNLLRPSLAKAGTAACKQEMIWNCKPPLSVANGKAAVSSQETGVKWKWNHFPK